jgi:hypothetical protein
MRQINCLNGVGENLLGQIKALKGKDRVDDVRVRHLKRFGLACHARRELRELGVEGGLRALRCRDLLDLFKERTGVCGDATKHELLIFEL